MKRTASFCVVCFLLVCSACPQQQAAQSHFDGKTWWDYVKVLADDKMEGRETGSAGLRRAEAYIVEQLKKDGLQPAGVNGFYQPVKFVSRQIVERVPASLLSAMAKPSRSRWETMPSSARALSLLHRWKLRLFLWETVSPSPR
jgi:hypothetical protein